MRINSENTQWTKLQEHRSELIKEKKRMLHDVLTGSTSIINIVNNKILINVMLMFFFYVVLINPDRVSQSSSIMIFLGCFFFCLLYKGSTHFV